MKRCPKCSQVYDDESLNFCLDDGEWLTGESAVTEPATAILSGDAPSSESSTRHQITQIARAETRSITNSAEYFFIKRHKNTVTVILAMVAITSGLALALYKFSAKKPAAFQSIKISKLTNIGNATAAQISPNGEYLAHVLYENGQNSIRVWDIATKSSIDIVPPTPDSLIVSAFSPDSRHIFVRRDAGNQPAALYQFTVLGGTPRKVLDNLTGNASISPDGKTLAFVRSDTSKGETSLNVADIENATERVLATRKSEERFSLYEPAWSPDGKLIVEAAFVDGAYMTLVTVSVADGGVKPTTPQQWVAVQRAAWLNDGTGLMFSAVDESGKVQIWYASYPTGEIRRITNDANTYGSGSISITSDSLTLATIQTNVTSSISVAPLDDLARAKPITSTTSSGVQPYGISWTPDGRLVYSSTATGNSEVWMMNADGTGNRQITNFGFDTGGPTVSPDGKYIVFDSKRAGPNHIWRMDIGGGNVIQLTNGPGDAASNFTPDGRWVVYDAVTTADLRKVSVDGGEPVRLTQRRVAWPTVAPTNGMIAGLFRTDGNAPSRLVVYPPDGGEPIKSFDLPPGGFKGDRWSADGRTIYYCMNNWSGSAIWSQSFEGGAPKKIADFTPEQIGSFDISRDGKSIAFSHGTIIRDVVLITDIGKQ